MILSDLNFEVETFGNTLLDEGGVLDALLQRGGASNSLRLLRCGQSAAQQTLGLQGLQLILSWSRGVIQTFTERKEKRE